MRPKKQASVRHKHRTSGIKFSLRHILFYDHPHFGIFYNQFYRLITVRFLSILEPSLGWKSILAERLSL